MSRTDHHGDTKKQRLFKPWFWFKQTPSWWTRMKMQKPQRRAASNWQRQAEKTAINELPQIDNPPHGKKPHHYYW